uniref:RING-type domain-containing protein n=1 Tax=Panagrolaimus davidi TaxID=227884 RepID=A0A914PS41_9BILA
MGSFLTTCASVIVPPVFEAVKCIYSLVIDFFTSKPKPICDRTFSQRQFEYSSQENQAQTQELIEEQRRKKARRRQMMTCKCCNNNNLVDYTFDCAHMVCGSCNRSTCANRCFECKEIIRERIPMDYPRHELI